MPVIDAHAHVSVPAEVWAYKAGLLSHRGAHGKRRCPVMSDDELIEAYHKKEMAPVGHLESMKNNGIDMQLISPRPFQMMHSEKFKLVQWFTEEVNNIIYRDTQLFPGTFYGVCSMPQAAGEPIEKSLPELERCIKELGFVGTLLNPDPYENTGTEAPPLGDQYWYPLYEKLCELDVPAHIHGTDLALRAHAVHAALHQRGDDRGLRAGQLERLQGFPDAEDRRLARRRRDPLSVRPLPVGLDAQPARPALQRRAEEAVLRHACSTPSRRSSCWSR